MKISILTQSSVTYWQLRSLEVIGNCISLKGKWLSGILSLKAQRWIAILVTFKVCWPTVSKFLLLLLFRILILNYIFVHLSITVCSVQKLKLSKVLGTVLFGASLCSHWYLCTVDCTRPEWSSLHSHLLSLQERASLTLNCRRTYPDAQTGQSSPFPCEVGLPVGSNSCPSLSPRKMPGDLCVSSWHTVW